jgi:hypothetical protein
MDYFDDLQTEEFCSFDFVEEVSEDLFEGEKNNEKSFQKLLNSNKDF